MKFKYINILFLINFTLLSSCSDWLDVTGSTEIDRDDLFQNEVGYSEALSGVYAGMCNPSLYGRHLTYGIMDIMAGRYNITYGSFLYFIRSYMYKRADEEGYEKNYCITFVDEFWNQTYNIIANLNSIINTIDGDKGLFSENNYDIVKGEAIGLRAFLHFEILRMYTPAYDLRDDKGIIPFVSELNTMVSPLQSVDDILKIIIEDLNESLELLKTDPMHLGTTPSSVVASPIAATPSQNIETWHNRRFHFNFYAVKATLARIYLWMGDKTNALKYAQELIDVQEQKFPWVRSANVTTISNTSTSSNQDRTFATEHIFALNMVQLDSYIRGYLNYDYSYSGNSFPFYAFVDLYEDIWADYRRQYLFETSGTDQLFTKFNQIRQVHSYFKERIPMIRISEMYYIAAECIGGSQGVKYLNTVRDNRGLSAYQLSENLTNETLADEILKEYRKEFFGEGQLWFYYKRHHFQSIPNTQFHDISRYTFDRPENEDFYR